MKSSNCIFIAIIYCCIKNAAINTATKNHQQNNRHYRLSMSQANVLIFRNDKNLQKHRIEKSTFFVNRSKTLTLWIKDDFSVHISTYAQNAIRLNMHRLLRLDGILTDDSRMVIFGNKNLCQKCVPYCIFTMISKIPFFLRLSPFTTFLVYAFRWCWCDIYSIINSKDVLFFWWKKSDAGLFRSISIENSRDIWYVSLPPIVRLFIFDPIIIHQPHT